jgi:hypothetical protein
MNPQVSKETIETYEMMKIKMRQEDHERDEEKEARKKREINQRPKECNGSICHSLFNDFLPS